MNTESLDAIQARLDAATPGAVTITPSDVAFLLDLAREQQAALEGVLAELERRAVQYRATADGLWELVHQRHPDRDFEDAQRYEAYATGARATVGAIRAALEAKP
jgi:ketosteroid isomerase-like protein